MMNNKNIDYSNWGIHYWVDTEEKVQYLTSTYEQYKNARMTSGVIEISKEEYYERLKCNWTPKF